MRRDEQRLQDILEALSKIKKFAVEGREAFEADERTQVWMASSTGRSRSTTDQTSSRRHSDITRFSGSAVRRIRSAAVLPDA